MRSTATSATGSAAEFNVADRSNAVANWHYENAKSNSFNFKIFGVSIVFVVSLS